MSVVVITPPAPIVTPKDIAGSHAPDDAMMAALIQAATEEIDGPSGWVGRCFGPQTLEARLCNFPLDVLLLPYRPLIEVVSVKYDDAKGVEQTVPTSSYRLLDEASIATAGGAAWPITSGQPGSVRVRYRAGYEEGKTGKVPERARQAVILMATTMSSALEAGGGLRSFEVTGAFNKQFNSPEMMERVRSTAVDRLLRTLRVYA